MNVELSKKAAKVLSGLDKQTKARIVEGIYGISDGDIKPLKGYSDGRQRLRIGKYRVSFCYMTKGNDKLLYIMEIGSRGDIYK